MTSENSTDGAFHWRNGVYFKRLENGDVRIFQKGPNDSILWGATIDCASWVSAVTAVSFNAERSEAFQKMMNFHMQDEF